MGHRGPRDVVAPHPARRLDIEGRNGFVRNHYEEHREQHRIGSSLHVALRRREETTSFARTGSRMLAVIVGIMLINRSATRAVMRVTVAVAAFGNVSHGSIAG